MAFSPLAESIKPSGKLISWVSEERLNTGAVLTVLSDVSATWSGHPSGRSLQSELCVWLI
jgi:hypothetical protein